MSKLIDDAIEENKDSRTIRVNCKNMTTCRLAQATAVVINNLLQCLLGNTEDDHVVGYTSVFIETIGFLNNLITLQRPMFEVLIHGYKIMNRDD